MYSETLIGFDCREMWLSNIEHNRKYLSINRLTWNSIFFSRTTNVDGEWLGAIPNYPHEIPEVNQTSTGFWDDLKAMANFIDQNIEKYMRPFWMIGVTVVQTPEYNQLSQNPRENHNLLRIPISLDVSIEVIKDWELLGYDVQDGGPTFLEGLSLTREFDQSFSETLNRHFLFGKQDEAVKFAHWCEIETPNTAPYFSYGMYLIKVFR